MNLNSIPCRVLLPALQAMVLSACTTEQIRDALQVEADNVTVNGNTYLLYRSDSPFGEAASTIQQRFPNMKEARKSDSPKFIDSHPAGVNHAELKGFGVTMVAHNGGLIPGADDIEYSSARVDDPNLLFFDKGRSGKYKEWEIIGMGYSMPYRPQDRPVLLTRTQLDPLNPFTLLPSDPLPGVVHRFLVHEAGYHNLLNGEFIHATDNDLTNAAINAGKSIYPLGEHIIDHDDMKSGGANKKRHGRMWTLHVWFQPGTGRPVVAETDPWYRSVNGLTVPDVAFYDVSN
ncbi:MAG: hypothetical protein KKC01_09920 [Gammaproteobacteria bacterium]|nr:hypothetical protein [Gammaproteobacteria bacterium]